MSATDHIFKIIMLKSENDGNKTWQYYSSRIFDTVTKIETPYNFATAYVEFLLNNFSDDRIILSFKLSDWLR